MYEQVRTNIEIEDTYLRAAMDRYGLHTKTEAVDLALRHLAGQPMTREEALAMRALTPSRRSLRTLPGVPGVILAGHLGVGRIRPGHWQRGGPAHLRTHRRRRPVAVTEPVIMEVASRGAQHRP